MKSRLLDTVNVFFIISYSTLAYLLQQYFKEYTQEH